MRLNTINFNMKIMSLDKLFDVLSNRGIKHIYVAIWGVKHQKMEIWVKKRNDVLMLLYEFTWRN
jgi:hypothetical protein